jgi:hypothetical protein
MVPARISCPFSQALTFVVILRATSSTRGRSDRGNSRANPEASVSLSTSR